jgi:hypothetical protein
MNDPTRLFPRLRILSAVFLLSAVACDQGGASSGAQGGQGGNAGATAATAMKARVPNRFARDHMSALPLGITVVAPGHQIFRGAAWVNSPCGRKMSTSAITA